LHRSITSTVLETRTLKQLTVWVPILALLETNQAQVDSLTIYPLSRQSLSRSSDSIHAATAANLSFVSSPEIATGYAPIQEHLLENVRSHLLSSRIVEKENTSQKQLKFSKLHPTVVIGTALGILSPETVAGSTSLHEFLDYQYLLLYYQSKKDVDPQPLPKTLQVLLVMKMIHVLLSLPKHAHLLTSLM